MQRSVTYFSTPLTILIQEVVWSSNRDGTLTSTLYPPIVLQTFTSKTKPNRPLLQIHPFAQFSSSSSRGSAYSRHKDRIFGSYGDGRALKNCPTSTKFKPASEHNLDSFWSSGSLSNLCSKSCKRFPCRCRKLHKKFLFRLI